MSTPLLKRQLAETMVLLRKGKFLDAKKELRTIQYCAEEMPDPEGHWDNIEESVSYFINWVSLQIREGRSSGFTREEEKQFQEDVSRVVREGEKPEFFHVTDQDLASSTCGRDSELAEATEAVLQDQIKFLEEELRKSEEQVMELKQELDELKSGES